MGQTILTVDAFTDRPFAGNPAAVCVLPRPADEAWMRALAREMNLSETAFLHPEDEGYRLRWFTPAVEVDLCGHATLASAHVLWEEGHLRPDQPAKVLTHSGRLTASRSAGFIELDFPSKPMTPEPAPPELTKALGVPVVAAGRNEFDWLVELESEETLRALQPDFGLLATLPIRGTIVTSRATTSGFDFVSRFFAPRVGVPEDPVTGSAHCALTPFWAERLGKVAMVAHQASPRGGVMRVRLNGDRVLLVGQAVTVVRGEIVANATGQMLGDPAQ
jgi:PhzF family phenazine biosynthesis protein